MGWHVSISEPSTRRRLNSDSRERERMRAHHTDFRAAVQNNAKVLWNFRTAGAAAEHAWIHARRAECPGTSP